MVLAIGAIVRIDKAQRKTSVQEKKIFFFNNIIYFFDFLLFISL
jgi:hypothetical protein